MKAISIQALMTVIERHKLKPVNGEYQISNEMIAEAMAIDEARGTGPSSEKLAELEAAAKGQAKEWKMIEEPEK
jgi:hypothetical protein